MMLGVKHVYAQSTDCAAQSLKSNFVQQFTVACANGGLHSAKSAKHGFAQSMDLHKAWMCVVTVPFTSRCSRGQSGAFNVLITK